MSVGKENSVIISTENWKIASNASNKAKDNPNYQIDDKIYNLAQPILQAVKNKQQLYVKEEGTKNLPRPIAQTDVSNVANNLEKPIQEFEKTAKRTSFQNWSTLGKTLSGVANFLKSCLSVLTYNLTYGKAGERMFQTDEERPVDRLSKGKDWKLSDKNAWGASDATQLARKSFDKEDIKIFIKDLNEWSRIKDEKEPDESCEYNTPTKKNCNYKEYQSYVKSQITDLKRALTDIYKDFDNMSVKNKDGSAALKKEIESALKIVKNAYKTIPGENNENISPKE